MLRQLPIRRKILLVAAIPVVAMIAIAATGYSTIRAVRVGSANFTRAESAQVLIADLLPPPLYIVEAWAEANHIQDERDVAELKEHKERLARAEREYSDRYTVWSRDSRVINNELRAALLEKSDKAAREFFTVLKARYIPALERAQNEQAKAILYDELEPLYDQHYDAVLESVKAAESVKASADKASRDLVNQRTLISLLAFLGGLALAVVASVAVARAIARSLRTLRDGAEGVVRTLTSTDLEREVPTIAPVEVETNDELAEAAASFNSVVGTTVQLLERQRQARQKTSELFVNLGRRNQNLVSRQLRLIDELEHSDADSETLTKVFKIDHIATRMRRNAESLLVMAGLETPRRWKNALAVSDVVRSAVSEVEQFDRVDVGDLTGAKISGKAAADVAHLMAELVENAVRYSPPDAMVHIEGDSLADGSVRLSVIDRGTGMTATELAAAAIRLSGQQSVEQAQTAYLGHFVVGRLAARHGIIVRLESSGGEGVTAYIDLPADILAADQPAKTEPAERSAESAFERAPTRRAAPPAPTPAKRVESVGRQSVAKTEPAPEPVTVGAVAAPSAPARNGTAPDAETAPATTTAATAATAATAEFTDAGYRRRTPKGPAAAVPDRFAPPVESARPRSSEAMRARLNNFSAGKARAAGDTDNEASAPDDNEGSK